MITAGITGGIGSGKSVVSELFRLHGIPVFDADSEAKQLNDTSTVIRKELTALFGKDLYAGGSLNRKQLATLMFADRQKVEAVNAIVHPILARHFLDWCSLHQNHPVVMIEAALLFEAGFVRYLDKVITVFAPKSIRLARVTQRDHTTREAVEERMKHQLLEEEKVERSDYVIHNDGSQSLILQTATILDDLLRIEEQ
jgi:dephospho-CoA kinase